MSSSNSCPGPSATARPSRASSARCAHVLCPCRPRTGQQGFTLLEILLAIFVFSLVISMIYMTMGRSMTLANDIEQQAELYAMARTTLLRIQEDMEAIPRLPKDTGSGPVRMLRFVLPEPKAADDEQQRTVVQFLSRADLPLAGDTSPRPLGSLITYETQKMEDTTLTLFRTASPLAITMEPQPTTGDRAILCELLTGIDFQVTDVDGQEHTDWDTDANPEAGLPQRITVTLRFRDPSEPSGESRFMTSFFIPAIFNR